MGQQTSSICMFLLTPVFRWVQLYKPIGDVTELSLVAETDLTICPISLGVHIFLQTTPLPGDYDDGSRFL